MPREVVLCRFVAARLRQIRLSKGLLSCEAAQRAAIHPCTYSSLEFGRTSIHLGHLLRMQFAVGACLEEFWPPPPDSAFFRRADSGYVRRAVLEARGRVPQPVRALDIVNAVGLACLVSYPDLVGRETSPRLRRARRVVLLAHLQFPHIPRSHLAVVLRRRERTLARTALYARREWNRSAEVREKVREVLRLLAR